MRKNPYRLADDVAGVGFQTADEIAARVGIHADSDFRIRSGIFYTLMQSIAEGHVYLTRDVLALAGGRLLGVEISHIETYLMDLAMEKKVVAQGRRRRVAGSMRRIFIIWS